MVSSARDEWLGTRRARLSTLFAMSRPGTAAPEVVAQAEWALVVQLSAEFQGYCRDLYVLARDEIMDKTAAQTPALEAVVRRALSSRAIATGNAGARSIEQDFARLGLGGIWSVARREEPASRAWVKDLERFLKFRNAIAHGDYARLRSLAPPAQSLRDLCFGWRAELTTLIDVLDRVVAAWLSEFLQLPRPW